MSNEIKVGMTKKEVMEYVRQKRNGNAGTIKKIVNFFQPDESLKKVKNFFKADADGIVSNPVEAALLNSFATGEKIKGEHSYRDYWNHNSASLRDKNNDGYADAYISDNTTKLYPGWKITHIEDKNLDGKPEINKAYKTHQIMGMHIELNDEDGKEIGQ